jgi:hypothetical protein
VFGAAILLGGCAGGGNADAQQSQQDEQLRREASRVFSDRQDFNQIDPDQVFVAPGADGSLMTPTLSIDGEPGQTTTGASASPQAPMGTERWTTDDTGWAILLERISGPQHRQRALQRAASIARAMGRTDVRARIVSSGSAVVLGDYTGPEDERAQRDLQYVKSLSSGGARPYAMAMMVPPPLRPGSTPQFDLLVAAEELDPIYEFTLQIAAFTSEDESRRDEAERYARQLRRQGLEAFYFHGRRGSSVTVGTFAGAEFSPDADVLSPALEQLQEQFPHNLLNGEVVRDPQTGTIQTSVLVRIPRRG